MLLYFLKMMSQKSNQICIQLLQTLSILFENIRNETSLCEYLEYKTIANELDQYCYSLAHMY